MSSWVRKFWDAVFYYLDSFFEKHKGARRIALFVALGQVVVITYVVCFDHDLIKLLANSQNGGWYALLIGHLITLNAGLVGLYKWSRDRDETRRGNP